MDCGAPAQIEFGSVSLINGTTTVKSSAVYACLEDYWLVGEARQECGKEGKWSHDTPSCERKKRFNLNSMAKRVGNRASK